MDPTERGKEASDGQPAELNLSWADVLLAYRTERTERSAAVLLERLGPWLTNARKSLLEAPPFADREDVAQELVLEVLSIAVRWQPHCEDRWIPRKLVEAAERKVRRSLRRERGRQTVELDDQLPAARIPELSLGTPIGRASAADIQFILRFHVLGEPLEVMARALGITPRQMRRRIQKAKERARA
jgi:hypothetical protein